MKSKKEAILSTLFVGIDIGSRIHAIHALDFFSESLLVCAVPNDNRGATELANRVAAVFGNAYYRGQLGQFSKTF